MRRCVDKKSFLEAIDALEFLGRGQRIVVEDDVPITESWCANIIVGTDEVAFAGSALQVFQSPGIQSGSMIDPARPLPDAARSIALVAGEIARQRGFIGPAGIDIGQTPQGKLVVFDPNFRVNGSLSQVLLHRGAAARSGLPASLSVSLSSPLPMSEIIRRLRGPVGAAWFMPTRCCDARLLPAIEGQSQVLGFILAPTAAELNLPLAELEALLKV